MNAKKSNGTKGADKLRGRAIGAGDGANGHKFVVNEPLVGRLESVATVTTRYGERCRLTMTEDETGELVSAFLPARWTGLLSPEVGGALISITRVRDESNPTGGVRYDVRAFD